MQIDGVGKKKIYPAACGLLGFRYSRTEWAAAWAELRHSLMLMSLHPPWARLHLFPSTDSVLSAIQACAFIQKGSPVVTPHLHPQDWPWLTLLKPLNFFSNVLPSQEHHISLSHKNHQSFSPGLDIYPEWCLIFSTNPKSLIQAINSKV